MLSSGMLSTVMPPFVLFIVLTLSLLFTGLTESFETLFTLLTTLSLLTSFALLTASVRGAFTVLWLLLPPLTMLLFTLPFTVF